MKASQLVNIFCTVVMILGWGIGAKANTIIVSPGQSIQAAIDAAADGDQIQVAPGIYYETVNFKGKAIWLHSIDGPEATIIDGQNVRRGVQCISGEDPNTVLEGFTIRNCRADQGAGMYNENSSPTITGCTFSNNTAGAGGGMYNLKSRPILTFCTLASNSTFEGIDGKDGDHPTDGEDGGAGAGMYNNQSNAIVSDCIFTQNTTGRGGTGGDCSDTSLSGDGGDGGSGAGVWNLDCSPEFTRCIFSENQTGRGARRGNDSSVPYKSGNGGNGAGMFNNNAAPVIEECLFIKNITGVGGINARYANGGDGGCGAGIYNLNSSPTIHRCEFTENQTGNGGYTDRNFLGTSGGFSGKGGDGAGISNVEGSPMIYQCIFRGNRTGNGGQAGSAAFMLEVSLDGASGGDGGYGAGIYNTKNAYTTVIACQFIENTTGNGASGGNGGFTLSVSHSGGDGGDGGNGGLGAGICSKYSSSTVMTIKDCIFIRNVAGNGGARGNGGLGAWGMYGADGIPGKPGNSGIANYGASVVVTNCTFRDNQSPGVIYNSSPNSNSIITNCILWDIQSPEVINENCSPVLTYCDVRDGTSQPWFGLGCIEKYPLFMDDAGRIPPYSPCAGAGNNDAPGLSEFDLDGNPRIIGGQVDMGAYECALLSVRNVNTGQNYEKIQLAINEANPGDQISVLPGRYMEAIDFKGKAIRLFSSHGPESTTIDGTGSYHTIQCISGEGPGTVLDGFTVTGGKADGGLEENFEDGDYAGWRIIDQGNRGGPSVWSVVSGRLKQSSNIHTYPYDDNPPKKMLGTFALWRFGAAWKDYEFTAKMMTTDDDNIGLMFRYKDEGHYYRVNWGRDSGHYRTLTLGKMTTDSFEVLDTNTTNILQLNHSYSVRIRAIGPTFEVYIDDQLKLSATDTNGDYYDSGSVALFCWGNSSVYFDDIGVKGVNYTAFNTFGGGMLINGSSPTVTHCVFAGNSAVYGGGGMANVGGNPLITNCIFRLNSVLNETFAYGGGLLNSGVVTVTHCTFNANTSKAGGAAIGNLCSAATITNCILWGNIGDGNPQTDELVHGGCLFGSPKPLILTSSIVEGAAGQSWFGPGCIDADPKFADLNGRLLPGSPCIDAGRNDAPGLPSTDLDGHLRIVDGNGSGTAEADMGAFEFNFVDKGDFDYSGRVDLPDLLIMAESWLARHNESDWNRFCNIGKPQDERINLIDFKTVAENWLKTFE